LLAQNFVSDKSQSGSPAAAESPMQSSKVEATAKLSAQRRMRIGGGEHGAQKDVTIGPMPWLAVQWRFHHHTQTHLLVNRRLLLLHYAHKAAV
jgi:hypothetical protein